MVAYSTVNPLRGLLTQRRSESLLICLNLEVAPLKPGELKYCKILENDECEAQVLWCDTVTS